MQSLQFALRGSRLLGSCSSSVLGCTLACPPPGPAARPAHSSVRLHRVRASPASWLTQLRPARQRRRGQAARRRDSRPDGDREERARARAGGRPSAARSSTATRRRSIAGFDIGTDKVALADRRGIPHHLIDIADPTDEYTAAQYARDAARRDPRDARARRAAVRRRRDGLLLPRADAGPVPGAGKRRRAAPAAVRRSPNGGASRSCTACSRRVDRESALRIQPRDLKRIVRALEVFFLTGRPLTAHFAETTSPIAGRGRARHRPPPAGRGHLGARDEARGRAVRARAAGRDSRTARDAACRKPRGRSAGSSIGRRSSTCTASATRRRRAR